MLCLLFWKEHSKQKEKAGLLCKERTMQFFWAKVKQSGVKVRPCCIKSKKFFFLFITFIYSCCMFVHVYKTCEHGSYMTTCQNWFFSSAFWVQRIKFKPWGLVTNTFTCWAIFLVLEYWIGVKGKPFEAFDEGYELVYILNDPPW